ncbi:MAG TPA: hypothetical protein HA362_05070, partial [Nanoarchaeota archaeon]|nr:hypothetical protein [Nanoarchaeota archaeon]
MEKRAFKVILVVLLVCITILYLVQGVGLTENRQWAGNLTGMHHSALAVGDLNNDNMTDLILVGCTAGAATSCTSVGAYVYTNNGTSLNYNLTWSQNLTAVGRSSIAIGDIDNDGDLDVIIAGSSDYSTADATRVYINNGTVLVANQSWQQNISNANVYGGSIALGDVNNDGRLDLAISGADNSGYEGIYINNGSSFNKDYTWTPSGLPNGGKSTGLMALSWADLDSDSKLDLIVMGSQSTTFYANVFINNGTSLVQNTTWEQNLLTAFGWPSITFGDYDNDGDMDMAYMGTRVGDKLRIYNNNKNGFSSNQTEADDNLIGIFDGAVAFGDYDNDGDLDIAAMGKEPTYDRIYKNNNTLYVRDTNAGVDFQNDNLQQGSLLWNDIDNDGDIDIISTGKIGDTSIMNATIYINNATLTTNNSIPYPPLTFDNHSLANGDVFLSWNNGSDNQTLNAGLYYNLRVGTTSGGNNIVSGVFGSSSRPTAGYFGNMMQRRNISLSGSRFNIEQTYYWSIQTIDTGLAKSAWSTEQTFTLTSDFTPPVVTLNAPSEGLVTNQTQNIVFNATVYDDYNLTNVSLYGNWTGTWHLNTTNSSGINNTNYIFRANATEGNWLWGIRACDATSNCRGSNSTFRIDSTYPAVVLVSPANGTSQTSSNAVTFTYNVSDIAINNCTLYLNSAANETDISITVNTSQTFAENVPNGGYNWSVRCADAANNI